MPEAVHILAQVSWNTPSEFEVFHGVRDFMRLRPGWALRLSSDPYGDDPDDFHARILTTPVPGLRKRLGRRPGPVVSVINDDRADLRVIVDDARIGELAARHLHERGFRQLLFASDCDEVARGYRLKRLRGFERAAAEQGASVTIVEGITRPSPRNAAAPRWLSDAPRPCGVFCPDDRSALVVLDCCRAAGVPVPEELAIVGADNEALWCETAVPPLSSVAIPWRRVGFEAAAWIERLLQGERPPSQRVVVLPIAEVAARQSTDSVALSDPLLVSALRFIREQAFAGISVKAVEQAVGINRRRLDRLFQRSLGRTPFDEIRRLQIAKAKELLACTDLPPREVAAATGMSSVYFAANFRAATGVSAAEYRRDHARAR
jgi:LacI family transcriptional regulator